VRREETEQNAARYGGPKARRKRRARSGPEKKKSAVRVVIHQKVGNTVDNEYEGGGRQP
jgi:hypothetical protein